ncbi:hypothetical protein J6590_048972 [Homalodisca vitripennis]|nr:hypothetical protein J6590_048972 [Homalodisca vitripennis]
MNVLVVISTKASLRKNALQPRQIFKTDEDAPNTKDVMPTATRLPTSDVGGRPEQPFNSKRSAAASSVIHRWVQVVSHPRTRKHPPPPPHTHKSRGLELVAFPALLGT